MQEPPIEELKALAHPLRFRILAALTGGELNVGGIEEASGIAQPTLSQQLAILRGADLVSTRRVAKSVFYALDRPAMQRISTAIAALLPEQADAAPPAPSARPTGAAVFARLGS